MRFGVYDFELAVRFERLPEARRPELFVQAGSTLRDLGRLDEARALLERGRKEWPGFRAVTAFLSLVELSAGNDRRAALLLLEDAVGDHGTDASLRRYGCSLRAYAADLERDGEETRARACDGWRRPIIRSRVKGSRR